MIMAKTHHRSIRTAACHTRPGLAAITQATALLDPPAVAAGRGIATINSTLSCPNQRKRCFFAGYYGRAS